MRVHNAEGWSGGGWGGKKSAAEIFERRIVMRRLLHRALLEIGRKYSCEECGLQDTWHGKTLRLQVDHIDGDNTNNAELNLRFLCPNCHSQTPTFSKNKDR